MWKKSIFLFFVGSCFFIVGLVFAGPTARFLDESEPAMLRVVRVEQKQNRTEMYYRPVFTLADDTQLTTEYAGAIWLGAKQHSEGDVVEGRYATQTGEMRSSEMAYSTLRTGRISQLIGVLIMLLPLLAPGLVRRARWSVRR